MSAAASFDERAALLRSENRPYTSLGSVHQNKCKVYKRRWYILALFSVVASLNNVIWNTWGPIQGTSRVVFGWDETTITLLADWGPISYVVAVAPMSWLMDVKGRSNQLTPRWYGLIWYGITWNQCSSRDRVADVFLCPVVFPIDATPWSQCVHSSINYPYPPPPPTEGRGNSEGWGGLKGIFFWEVGGQQSNRIFQRVDKLQRVPYWPYNALDCSLDSSMNIAFPNHIILSFFQEWIGSLLFGPWRGVPPWGGDMDNFWNYTIDIDWYQ